ncbi:TPR repeat containing protein [Pochonia chlamydosporia 170]|uniref:TPR repeat containing protein n=1 Tax=Pochonia chlamydosporia 170 TaxID=1380566 RepID=A0A179G875_METCM|nr:TPR repeat containing protein [Pochonia chlamydosporia 170]OAQ73631.1 TPR repeat containing protein [Pochonia chlamydosporia 170]
MRFISDNLPADRSSLGPRIQVIAAGLPRCATSSLQAGLESPHLGYAPCMHMAHVLPHPERSQLILEAIQEKDTTRRRRILHKIFDGYEATTDFPGCWFIDDLMDMYPDAAIVLNQRQDGGEGWMKSFTNSLGLYMTFKYYAMCFLCTSDRIHYNIHQEMGKRWVKKFGVELGPELYDAHQDFVLREAKERGREVLIWKAQDGWDPLCKFLGKETPKSEPFPWVNDTATMKVLQRILISRGLLSWAGLLGGVCVACRYGPSLFGLASVRLVSMFG